MQRMWETLRAAGLPDGAARPLASTYLDAPAVRDAVRELSRLPELGSHDVEVLHAWLAAFRHHWPGRFLEILGPDGEAYFRRVQAPCDPNRFLKLRRIAIESLARIL